MPTIVELMKQYNVFYVFFFLKKNKRLVNSDVDARSEESQTLFHLDTQVTGCFPEHAATLVISTAAHYLDQLKSKFLDF